MAVIDDLKKNLGQKVVLSLRNGEKSGTILEIEEFADPPSILFQEPTGASRSIAIPLIFMVESAGDGAVVERQQEIKALPVYQAPVYTPAPEPVKPAPEPQFVQSNQEVLAYRIRIESTYDAQSKAAHVDIFPPDFSTPPEIRGLNYGNSSEEPRDWTFIKNKYDNARRTGKLSPQSEDLREIINRCRKLTEHSTLHKSPVFHGYLGYFSYLNGAKQDAILALQKAAKLSDHPQDWNNLAAVALE
ncbi:MAG: hypothetical protein JNJ57_05340, partial [Saprospiraceae bacterium]|nr:hypothetical protein [Saprospiraceae bacterium]